VAVRQPPDSRRPPGHYTEGAATDPTPRRIPPIVDDPAGVIGAEVLAVRRGDLRPCQCCTSDPVRRAALDQLRAESHRLGIAAWADRMMPLAEHYSRWRVA
jgi:hypothetical protein